MRVHAKKFDGERDEEGRLFSEKWEQDGNGEWCYGTITHVYVRKGRQTQNYRIKYDEGSTMQCIEDHIETAVEGQDSECSTEAEFCPFEERTRLEELEEQANNEQEQEQDTTMDSDDTDQNDSEDDDVVRVGGVEYPITAKRRRTGAQEVTTVAVGATPILMGEECVAGLIRWKRIEGLTEDTRTEHHFDTYFKTNMFHDMTREVDVFNALLPVGREELLEIVRKNAEDDNDRGTYCMWHIDVVISMIFGGAQFKSETELWATETKGLMPAPDFGRLMSRHKFKRILRYWARGTQEDKDQLRTNPWAQVDKWVRGFNHARLREICPGSNLTPDEMMLEWKGKSGHGGLPHLSFIKRKPQPLGTELKSVCEGTFGMCVYIEIQKGKVRMAQKKWARTYGATTGCTLRLLDKLKLSELGDPSPKKRCVYADSWFASYKTTMALREELGLHFTGPIKTAHASFPIENMRATLATMKRGEHMVLECLDRDNIWAIGWQDNHFKTYITTHGHTRPGKPAHKKRQDIDGTNYVKEVTRPHILAKYQDEMGHVDRHNQFRQGLLHLAKTWKTKTWQTRIQLELLGLTLVDAFLACRVCMPQWKAMLDHESVFWKFAQAVITQLDSRPASERVTREDEEADPTFNCKHVSMGRYKIATGPYRGHLKMKQSRCKYCKERMKQIHQKGRAPPTCFECSFHSVAVCKKFNCWQRHLADVQRVQDEEFAI